MLKRRLLRNRWAKVIVTALTLAASGTIASGQSLNPKEPTQLAAGVNRGTVDSMVGPQYWSFKYRKGSGKITVTFTSMGLFGNPTAATIQVVFHNMSGQVVDTRAVTSRGKAVELDLPGNFKSAGMMMIEMRPPSNTLVRTGGDYTLVASGDAIDFSGHAGPVKEPVIGTYAVMVCPPDFDCQSSLSIRFAPDGTVKTTDGHSGTWKLFDPDAMIYSVVVGRDRWSLKLVPGRGLFNTSDLSVVIFQAVR
jgi:hypothetical protein